jgi:hypothetical protein
MSVTHLTRNHHFQSEKDELFYINYSSLNIHEVLSKEGHLIDIEQLMPHRILVKFKVKSIKKEKP